MDRLKAKIEVQGYMECYPSLSEAMGGVDAGGAEDSDDEAPDFSKMDVNRGKGPMNRWDFDNEDEFNRYMANREAMPKSAFLPPFLFRISPLFLRPILAFTGLDFYTELREFFML